MEIPKLTGLVSALLVVVAGLTAVYAVIMLVFAIGLRRLRRNKSAAPDSWPSVCVVMPARNEAEVLPWTLDSLMRQNYPGKWEVIVVDDRSEDNTPTVLAELCAKYSGLRSLRIEEQSTGSPKKRALAAGIAASDSEVILTTDADCQYHDNWLRGMVAHLTEGVGVVAGLTVFDLPDYASVPRWQKIQWLDFFVQNFLAAGSLGWGHAASCNGSNLCYRREVYESIEGFGAGASVVSGDDVLFAQRVAQSTTWKMVFATTQETLVRSLPVTTIRGLFQQRLRWASKGLSYRGSMLFFLFAIYFYYLLLLVLPVLAVLGNTLISAAAAVWGLKLAVDAVLVITGSRVFRQERLLPYFPEYEFWHTLTTPCFGLAGLLLPYRWKGDWYRTATLPKALRPKWLRLRGDSKPSRQPVSLAEKQ
ncbi:MAG: glycosyltransferase [Calditrichaeota bacterium]|nr:glycosyltransferase [Calditrichota bacterium]MCB9366463.1 glycosyltransferase [Calditrichota bacterium]MCB9391279.1 glycosyltransferase [Calditrichota bacterium]